MNNVGDSYVQSCCFANINQLVFCRSRCRRRRRRRRRCLSSLFFYCVGKRVEEKRSLGFLVAVFYKSFCDQACSVEMLVCWPRSFLRFYCPRLCSSRFIKMQKKIGHYNSAILTSRLVNNACGILTLTNITCLLKQVYQQKLFKNAFFV